MRKEKAASPDRPQNTQDHDITDFLDPQVGPDGKRAPREPLTAEDLSRIVQSLPKELTPSHKETLLKSCISEKVDSLLYVRAFPGPVISHVNSFRFYICKESCSLLIHKPCIEPLVEISFYTMINQFLQHGLSIGRGKEVVVPNCDFVVGWVHQVQYGGFLVSHTTFNLWNDAELTLPDTAARSEYN